jgi:hypothetical protein
MPKKEEAVIIWLALFCLLVLLVLVVALMIEEIRSGGSALGESLNQFGDAAIAVGGILLSIFVHKAIKESFKKK